MRKSPISNRLHGSRKGDATATLSLLTHLLIPHGISNSNRSRVVLPYEGRVEAAVVMAATANREKNAEIEQNPAYGFLNVVRRCIMSV